MQHVASGVLSMHVLLRGRSTDLQAEAGSLRIILSNLLLAELNSILPLADVHEGKDALADARALGISLMLLVVASKLRPQKPRVLYHIHLCSTAERFGLVWLAEV
jgi:hypothetical protein